MTLASDEDEPMVEITYTIPGTSISSGPEPVIGSRRAVFTFVSSQPDSTFECRTDQAEDFAPCESPVALEDLVDGEHRFEARAVNEMGNFAETPASRSFIVDTEPPVVKIIDGPSGKTGERPPRFAFSSSEADSTFRCRFDQEVFRACSGAASDRPAADLAFGAHTFAVKAIDRAGHASVEATREFRVDRGQAPAKARLKLKQPKLNRKKGFAVLPAQVSGPGRVVLLRGRSVKAAKRVAGKAKTVKLKVVARGKGRKKLRRKGKLGLEVRVRFTPESGAAAIKSKRVILRKARKQR